MLPWILATANLCVFLLYAADKHRARHGLYRIRERTLLIAAALGPYGALISMYALRHKTRKARFRVLVPLFAAIWTIAFAFCFSLSFP